MCFVFFFFFNFFVQRLCLHAAEALGKSGKHRRGCFAARHTARSLLQILEICRMEHQEKDKRFLTELLNDVSRPSSFRFPLNSPILWKGFVQLGLEPDYRLVICQAGALLVRKNTSFWSSASYELVGAWTAGGAPLSASFFSAREVSSSPTMDIKKESQLMYGVRLVRKRRR